MHAFFCAAMCLAAGVISPQLPSPQTQPFKEKKVPPWPLCKASTGSVMAITRTTITISDWQKPTQMITFPFHDTLAAGLVPTSATDCNAYRIQDVKIGDTVNLYTIVENKVAFCTSIEISERPGGLVPASQKPAKSNAWHDKINAANAAKKAGLPNPQPRMPKPISFEENETLRKIQKWTPPRIPTIIKK